MRHEGIGLGLQQLGYFRHSEKLGWSSIWLESMGGILGGGRNAKSWIQLVHAILRGGCSRHGRIL